MFIFLYSHFRFKLYQIVNGYMSNDANEANNATVTTQEKKQTGSSESRDTVFIGKKPLMAYVTSTLIQLANIPSVTIKAR